MDPRDGLDAAHDVRSWFVLVFGLVAAHGCGLSASYQKLANGDVRVECRGPLLPCLQPAADACADYGYDVVVAEERRVTTGSPPEQQQFVRSSATVRCRKAAPLVGGDPNVPPASSTASAPQPSPPAPRCVPGASQACATPTCTGAQVCVADGTRFGPCECPPAPVPSASSASSAPALDTK
jgi:hypothetical protein